MQGLNKVMLIGHLGKDPEYITFENGKTLAKCSLATSESYRNEAGELQTHTEWHNLIFWMGLAEYAHQYLKKGHLVYAEGKIKTRSFEDKDQSKRYVTEIIVEKISNLEKTSKANDSRLDHFPARDIEHDKDLPF
jgi:single-strand DNA-binding protein